MDRFPNLNRDKLRVLAADSTSMGSQLLVEALGKNEHFELIEAPSDQGQIQVLVQQEQPHIVLISATLGPDGEPFELVRNIRSQSPCPRVIVMLDRSEPSTVVQAFRAGAHGVFCRTEPFRLLAKCIECVHAGQIWASSHELHFVMEALTKPALASLQANGDSPLSARETDVVRCVAEGLTNRQIAQRLKLTEHTVKNYLFRIFDKLGVSSRVEVVLYALGHSDVHAINPPNNRKAHSTSVARRGEFRAAQQPRTVERKPLEGKSVDGQAVRRNGN